MAQEEQDDDVKKRALKRVGVAIVLALVAAVGLTMLSRSNKPAPQPEQTVLPAEPAAAIEQPASAVVQIAPEVQPASAVAETPPESDAPPTNKTPPPPPQVINNAPQPVGEPAHKPAKPLAAKPANMEAEGSAKPAPAAASQTGKPRSTQELVVTSKESVREALAKANGAPLTKPAETTKAPEPQKLAEAPKTAEKAPSPPPAPAPSSQPPAKGYAVQLGVFSNPANATQMQEKLAQHGIKSYTETKLNVGPFQNKEEAEAALAKLRGLGINAVVVPLSK
jgi:DedD protein